MYSIFEDHTSLIQRGKQRQRVEFGHKVCLAESAGDYSPTIRCWRAIPPTPPRCRLRWIVLNKSFHVLPSLYAGDRGFYSADHVDHCQHAGVSQVCIPQRGGQKTAEQEALERSRTFKKGQRFRVGIEGRISLLFRGRGMKHCRAKGRTRLEVLVGAAVLANNLLRIAGLLRNRKPALHAKAA